MDDDVGTVLGRALLFVFVEMLTVDVRLASTFAVEEANCDDDVYVEFEVAAVDLELAVAGAAAAAGTNAKRTALVTVGFTTGALVDKDDRVEEAVGVELRAAKDVGFTVVEFPLHVVKFAFKVVELTGTELLLAPYSVHVVELLLLLENVTSWQELMLLQECRQSTNESLPVVEFISVC